jgi:hypothetical protein
MITVNFRVVGVFFGCFPGDEGSVIGPISVQVKEAPTVFEVMRAVALKVANGDYPGVDFFDFSPSSGVRGEEIQSIRVKYSVGPRRDNPYYTPGVYVLEDTVGSNPNQVLQYYIVSPDGVQKNRNNSTRVFTAQPDAAIENGDTVIWRQVSICRGPNGGSRAISAAKRSLEAMRKV